MKKIIIASALCALTLFSSCSSSNSGYVGKGQIAYEEKYIVVKDVNGNTYGTGNFGQYYIFHSNGTFEDITNDGQINGKYKFYIDSAGDFYYQIYSERFSDYHTFDIWTGTVTKECFTKIGPYYDSYVYFAINENSEMYKTFKNSN